MMTATDEIVAIIARHAEFWKDLADAQPQDESSDALADRYYQNSQILHNVLKQVKAIRAKHEVKDD